MSIKYLSPSGLTEVWSNIKTYIASKIPSKIITGLSIKGRTITYTNSDGTTGTLTTQDTDTTYTSMSAAEATTGTATTARSISAKVLHDKITSITNTKANNSDVVHKSGDETIDGVKTFSGGSSTKIILQNTRMVNGQDDTVNRFWSISLTDKNNGENARILRFVNADNSSAFKLYEHYKGDSKNQVTMGPGHTQDGQGFVSWDAGIKNNTYPLTDNTYTLGTSTLKWKAVYANTFNGKLVGNADTATKATKDASGNVITDTYATKKELGSKADDANVVHKSGTETIAGTKTFSSQIKGNITGTSSDVVVGSDTATARGYLVDGNLPWYKWEEGSQLIAGRVPLITDFNNLTKPGVYHVIFCLNDGFVHEEKEYKESLNRPSLPNITTGFRDGILEIKKTSTMHTISSYNRFVQKLTVLSGATTSSYIGLTYQRVFSPYGEWTAWKRVARDEEVVHTTGDETINGVKTFSNDVNISKITPYYNIFSTGYIKGQAPTSNIYSGLRFYDDINSGSTNGITGSFEIEYNKDGYNKTFISSRNYANKTQILYHVGLRVPNDNTRSIDFIPSGNGIVNLGASTNKWKAVYANTFNGNLVGNAATAAKATQDAAGNVITTTYAKDANVIHKSGNETIAGLKTFSYWQIINMGLNVKWITGNKEQKSLFLFASMDDNYRGYGAELQLHTETLNGGFNIIAKDKTGTNIKFLTGDSNGSLTWCGANIVRTVNGVGANQAGNVTISTVANATKATQDSAGQQINTTYIKGVSVNGRTVTFTRGNGTTFAITIQDNVVNNLVNSFGSTGVGGICFVSGRTKNNIGGLGADVAGSDIHLVHSLGFNVSTNGSGSGIVIDNDYDSSLYGTWRLLGSVNLGPVDHGSPNAYAYKRCTLAIRIA